LSLTQERQSKSLTVMHTLSQPTASVAD